MKNNNNLLIGITTICVILLLSLFSFGFGSMMNGYGMMGGYGLGMMLFGWIMWILIIAGIYWLIKTANKK